MVIIVIVVIIIVTVADIVIVIIIVIIRFRLPGWNPGSRGTEAVGTQKEITRGSLGLVLTAACMG